MKSIMDGFFLGTNIKMVKRCVGCLRCIMIGLPLQINRISVNGMINELCIYRIRKAQAKPSIIPYPMSPISYYV